MKVGESKHYSGSQPECISTQTAGENGSEGGDLQIVPSWKKKEDRMDTWKQKKEKGRSLVYYHSHAKSV